MTSLRQRLNDVLFGPETGARLLIVHVGLSLLIAARVSSPAYHRLSELPDVLFDPVPFLAWLDSMPSAGVILAIQVVGAAAGIAAALRRRPRAAFAIAWLALLVLGGLRGSRGKVLHNDLLVIWVCAPFLLAPIEVTLRDRIPTRALGWCIRSATAVAALIYFFTGFHKLRRSGIDWVVSDNLSNIMKWGPSIGDTPLGWAATWIAQNRWAAVALAAVALTIEVSIPLALFWRRLLPLYALALVGLHVGNWLVLGLDYWGWAVTVLLLFVDWPAVIDRARSRWPRMAVIET